jgi:hypothetical protein
MLIEQRNDLHLHVARTLQTAKFSYSPKDIDIKLLRRHLKITEKSIINYMEDDDDDTSKSYSSQFNDTLGFNNMKLILVKQLTEKLKDIFHHNYPDGAYNGHPAIKYGILMKKSDKNITWEEYLVLIQSFCSTHNQKILLLVSRARLP